MNQSTAVEVPQDGAVADASMPVSFLHMIERASRDPNVDIDKMERLMAMHERMIAKQDETAFNDAMVQCQKEASTISADGNNPQTRSKYATYAKLDRVLRPIYTSHGMSISYSTADSPKPDHVRVIAYVSKGGYTRVYPLDMPADGKGAKGGDVMTKTHATGAAMSYGSRYLLKSIFNVAVGEEDADGNAGGRKAMAEGQIADFEAAIDGITSATEIAPLWASIVKECVRCGDTAAHQKLGEMIAAKKKSLK